VRRPELIHREGQHVGRSRLTHPPLVQFCHGALVDEQHRELGQRVNPQLVEREPGDRG